ncbi:unnamed protein product [Boreogadus saida]
MAEGRDFATLLRILEPLRVPLRNPSLHGAPHPGLEASHAQADLLPLPEAIPDDVNVRHISILLDGGYTKN